jgi:hypothetical protein
MKDEVIAFDQATGMGVICEKKDEKRYLFCSAKWQSISAAIATSCFVVFLSASSLHAAPNDLIQESSPPQASPNKKSLGAKLTISETDSLRRQIEKCWAPPAGVADATGLKVSIKISLDQSGKVVGEPEILSGGGDSGIGQLSAEAARRAIQKCQPFNLPAEKYDTWSELIFNFDPSNMDSEQLGNQASMPRPAAQQAPSSSISTASQALLPTSTTKQSENAESANGKAEAVWQPNSSITLTSAKNSLSRECKLSIGGDYGLAFGQDKTVFEFSYKAENLEFLASSNGLISLRVGDGDGATDFPAGSPDGSDKIAMGWLQEDRRPHILVTTPASFGEATPPFSWVTELSALSIDAIDFVFNQGDNPDVYFGSDDGPGGRVTKMSTLSLRQSISLVTACVSHDEKSLWGVDLNQAKKDFLSAEKTVFGWHNQPVINGCALRYDEILPNDWRGKDWPWGWSVTLARLKDGNGAGAFQLTLVDITNPGQSNTTARENIGVSLSSNGSERIVPVHMLVDRGEHKSIQMLLTEDIFAVQPPFAAKDINTNKMSLYVLDDKKTNQKVAELDFVALTNAARTLAKRCQ